MGDRVRKRALTTKISSFYEKDADADIPDALVGVAADQPNRADDKHHNDRQHHNVLSGLIMPEVGEETQHTITLPFPFEVESIRTFLRHISRGLNFGGVRKHFGPPLQSANLIGDFRRVAPIRNLCCRFQRLVDGRERKATAAYFSARQTILCAEIFCQSHT